MCIDHLIDRNFDIVLKKYYLHLTKIGITTQICNKERVRAFLQYPHDSKLLNHHLTNYLYVLGLYRSYRNTQK